MKHRLSVTVFFTLFFFGYTIAQKSYEQLDSEINALVKNDQRDSSEILLKTYIEKWTKSQTFDSLAWAKLRLAKSYEASGSIADITRLITEAKGLAVIHLKPNDPLYLDMLKFNSGIYLAQDLYTKAEDELNQILDITSKYEDPKGFKHKANLGKIQIELYQGDVSNIDLLENETLPELIKQNDTFAIIQAYQMLMLVNSFTGEQEKALENGFLMKDIISKKYHKYHPNVGIITNQLAGIYQDKGEIKKAFDLYEKGVKVYEYNYRNTGNARQFSGGLGDLGLTHIQVGDFKLGLQYLKLSLELNKSEYGENSETNMWHYQALLEANLKWDRKAEVKYYLDAAEKLASLSEEFSDRDIFNLRSYKGSYFRNIKEPGRALAIFKDQYDHLLRHPQKSTYRDKCYLINEIASCYSELGQYDEAYRWCKTTVDTFAKYYPDMHDQRILALNNFMNMLLVKGDTSDVEACRAIKKRIFKLRNNGKGIENFANCIPTDELLDFAYYYAIILNEVIPFSEGESEYFEFLADFEKYFVIHLSSIKSNQSIALTVDRLKDIYKYAIQYYVEDGRYEKAYQVTERLKSINTQLVLQHHLIEDMDNTPVIDITSLSGDFESDSLKVLAFSEVIKSMDQMQVYKDSLKVADPLDYQRSFGFNEHDMREIRSLLNPDESMVSFYSNDSMLYAFYIDSEDIKTERFNTSDISELINNIVKKKQYQKSSAELYNLLFKDHLSGKSALLVLPDRLLSTLSIGGLLDEKGNFLLENYSIRYANSANILIYQNKIASGTDNNDKILGLTPGFTSDLKELYAQNSASEIVDTSWTYMLHQPFLLNLSDKLSDALGNGTFLTESSATEEAFQKSSDFSILHLATHGIIDPESPLFSKIVFAKDSINDGYLHMYEIYGQNLDADLAVLSACSTGKETESGIDGVLSMSQAFTHAGCPSVLMTLWDVDEKSTATILESFYKELKNGKKKSVALRNAKLNFIRNAPQELKDPYYWAGLVLIGNDSAVMSSFSWGKYMFFGLGILILIFVSFYAFRNK